MWLPATLPSIYVVPSIAVQQTKQGDEHSYLHGLEGANASEPGAEDGDVHLTPLVPAPEQRAADGR